MRIHFLQHVPFEGLGFQFHLESTGESIGLLIENCGDELVSGKYIQRADEIRKQSDRIVPSNELMKSILEKVSVRCAGEGIS